jgi:MFS family permease
MVSHTSANNLKSTPALNRVLVLLGISVFINYIDRSNLSIAAPILKDELALSASQLGILLSAFFWTYSSCQLLSGWLVDRFDVKWVFAFGFFVWSAATAVTGLLHAFIGLLAARVVLGAGESVAYPAYSKIMANHFPENSRGYANSIVAAGLSLGPSVGILFGGTLIAHFGWRSFFIALGLVGLVWLAPWIRWMPPAPAASAPGAGPGPGILDILKQRSAWGTSICLFCGNYFLYFLLTWLPYYLVRERHFSLADMAKIGSAVFLLTAISATVCGRLSDRWIASGGTPTRVRKAFMVTSYLCVGLFLACSVIAPRTLSVVLLMLAGFSFGLSTPNVWAITQRLAGPQAVGRWCGVQLFIANLSGVVAPALTGFLLDRTGNFYWPFLITSAMVCAGALSWLFVVGPVEPIAWTTNTGDLTAKLAV